MAFQGSPFTGPLSSQNTQETSTGQSPLCQPETPPKASTALWVQQRVEEEPLLPHLELLE